MTDVAFVDTNVLVYAYDTDSGQKNKRAAALIRQLLESDSGCLSTQVLQEFYVSTQKLANPLPRTLAREVISSLESWVRKPTTGATVLRGANLAELTKISFWDALIIAAAEAAGASILYSEDLNAGQIIAGVKIVNPFAEVPA